MAESNSGKIFVGVTTAILAAGVIGFCKWFFGTWEAVFGAIGSCFSHIWNGITWAGSQLIRPVSVPLVVLIALGLFSVLYLLGKTHRNSKQGGSPWKSYVQDQFRGMLCRWQWSGNSPVDVAFFCPNDRMQLRWVNYALEFPPKHAFRCEHCGREFGPFDGRPQDSEIHVELQIRRKLEVGEWKDVVERSLPAARG